MPRWASAGVAKSNGLLANAELLLMRRNIQPNRPPSLTGRD